MKKSFSSMFAILTGAVLCSQLPSLSLALVIGGGGSELRVPDTIRTGEPTDIEFVVNATGSGGPIKGRFTDIILHYKLTDEASYHTAIAKPIPLPDNFKAVQSETFQSEAYQFTIPPYPRGTAGKVEYYTTNTFDGHANKGLGTKTITVSDTAKSSFDLKHNLSALSVCEREYKVDIITLEGIAVTKRIATLIDKEYQQAKDGGTDITCSAILKLPANAMLRSAITEYDSKKLQYLVTLEKPFVIDLAANKVYKRNDDNNLGQLMGSLQ